MQLAGVDKAAKVSHVSLLGHDRTRKSESERDAMWLYKTTYGGRWMDNTIRLTDQKLHYINLHMPGVNKKAWQETLEGLDLHLATMTTRDTIILGGGWKLAKEKARGRSPRPKFA